MLSATVEKYIASAKGLPFFYVVGDKDYLNVLTELKERGFIVDKASDFCPKEDKLPNIDEIIDHFRTLDVDFQKNRRVLIGLGECLALRGASFTIKELQRLKTTTLGSARVVILLRSIAPYVHAMAQEDTRLNAQHRIVCCTDTTCGLTITASAHKLLDGAYCGIKNYLHACEDGLTGNGCLSTALQFPNSLIPIVTINSAFFAIRHSVPDFGLDETNGTADHWNRLYQELSKNNFSFECLFSKYGFSEDFDNDLYINCAGFEFRNWLYFIYLKTILQAIANVYLQHVVSITDRFEDLRYNLLTAIVHISRKNADFDRFYADRKRLIRSFPESDIAIFLHENSIDPEESIYRFTDNTQLERECIIQWIAKHGYVDVIEEIYPALAQYMDKYVFSCGKLSNELTQYFTDYKMQKVINNIYPDFLEYVTENARSSKYTHLETRDSALLKIPEKNTAFLYWIDALGVEYLAYISHLAHSRGLTAHIEIAYAELPTITSINRAFFDHWPGTLKYKESELDEIKHKERGGFVFKDGEGALHLASELRVIDRAIDRAATELAMHKCKTFVITSDHGASRLAVIHKQEVKYETDTVGEHSGRCCKTFANADLPNAIEENGYLVLGDYGRFKGSRAANVEVHGGVSLEEVLVPVITLSLRKQTDVTIKLLDQDNIYCDRHAGTTIVLFVSDIDNKNDVCVMIGDCRYTAVQKDSSHYEISLSDMKRSRKGIVAKVFDGDDLIGSISFDIKSKTAIVKSSFDELF